MIVPYILTFIQSLLLSIFRIKHSPPFLLSIWVCEYQKSIFFFFWFLNDRFYFSKVHIVETCHTIGLSLLVFRILPSIDNVTGLFILNGICIVPAILNLFVSHRSNNQLLKLLTFISDIAAIFMQLSVCFIPYILPNADKISSKLLWELPLSLFLISLGYWESFTEINFFKQFRHHVKLLKKTRPKIYITVSLLKIFILITSAISFLPKTIDKQMYLHIFNDIPMGEKFHQNLGIFNEYDDLFRMTNQVYIPFLLQIISSCICYYTGRVACKVRRKKN